MMRMSMPPRWRGPVLFLAIGALGLIAGGAAYSWASAVYLAPIVIVVAVGYYLIAGRDSDAGALVRHQPDERQAQRRLQVQALVGRVLSIAIAVGYLIAVTRKSGLWPYGILLAILAITFAAGWLHYGDHGPDGDGEAGPRRRPLLPR